MHFAAYLNVLYARTFYDAASMQAHGNIKDDN